MVDMVNELDGKVAFVARSLRNIGRGNAEKIGSAGAATVVLELAAVVTVRRDREGLRELASIWVTKCNAVGISAAASDESA